MTIQSKRRLRHHCRRLMTLSIFGTALIASFLWMLKSFSMAATVSSVLPVVCFYSVVIVFAGIIFFDFYKALRSPFVRCGLFFVLFVWGCVFYFFNPVDRSDSDRVRKADALERVSVRGIETPNRVVAAFFPSRGGFEDIGDGTSAVAYFAFHTCVMLYITCLMFSIFGRGLVNRTKAIVHRRRLDVFWGFSEQGLLLAERIMKDTPDREVLFRLPVSLRNDKDKMMETTHRIDAIDCYWELSDFDIRHKSPFARWESLIGSRHFFFLDSGRDNVTQANRVVMALDCPDRDVPPVEFYVRIDAASDRKVYESWCNDADVKRKVEPIIVDEQEMMAFEFAERYARVMHPSTRVNARCEMLTPFNVLLVGLGRTGRAVLREIVCRGQLLMKDSKRETGLRVDVVDRREVRNDFSFKHPGLKNGTENELHVNLVDRIENALGEEFMSWLGDRIDDYQQIVLCLPEDLDNIELAMRIHELENLHGRHDLQIVAKTKESDANAYCRGKPWMCCFGTLKDLYTIANIDDSHVLRMAKTLHSKWKWSADDENNSVAEGKWRAASYLKRQSSRASAKGEFNFVRLLGFEVDYSGRNEDGEIVKPIEDKTRACKDVLGRDEHLRWNAYHVMEGYQRWNLQMPPLAEVESRIPNQLEYCGRHADIVPYDELPSVDLALFEAEHPEEAGHKTRTDFMGEENVCSQKWDLVFVESIVQNMHDAGFKFTTKAKEE